MAFITCNECGNEHSDIVDSCPHCGFKRNTNKKSGCMSWIAAIFIVIVLIAILLFMVVKQNIKDLKGEGLSYTGYALESKGEKVIITIIIVNDAKFYITSSIEGSVSEFEGKLVKI